MNGKFDPSVFRTARPIVGALFCFGLMGGHAQTVDANTALTYKVEGNSVTISDCKTSAKGALVIPSSYNGKPVTAIGNEAFLGCSGLTSVTIPDSVTSIENWAFSRCRSMCPSRKRFQTSDDITKK